MSFVFPVGATAVVCGLCSCNLLVKTNKFGQTKTYLGNKTLEKAKKLDCLGSGTRLTGETMALI